MIKFIWAESLNGVIGKNNSIPWRQSADMKRFKRLTTNHKILAGRNTFESFGKPLPNRTNLVLTNKTKFNFINNTIILHSIDDFLKYYYFDQADVYVIGGAKTYADLLPYANILYRTIIKTNIDGDTKIPKIDYNQFDLVDKQDYKADDKNQFDYSFLTYKHKII